MDKDKVGGNLGVGLKATGSGAIGFKLQFDDCTKEFEMPVDGALDLAKSIAETCRRELELQLFAEMFKF